MKKFVFGFAALLIIATPAFAQVAPQAVSGAWHSATFVSTPKPAAVAAAPAHKGFTFILDGGFGFQRDTDFAANGVGWSGLNVGAGWFVADNLAVMFRWTGTVVNFDDFNTHQASGVIGAAVQYWVSDKVAIEAGAGSGRVRDNKNTNDTGDDFKDNGFGLILGAFFPVWQKNAHHVLIGAEYVPVFADSTTVHGVSVNAAYQWGQKK